MKAVSNIPNFGPGQYWTRAKYDKEYLNVDLKQSMRPLEFSLDPNYSERCDRCLPTEVGWLGKQGVSYDSTRPMVDTESDLWNIGRPLSKDVHRYHPTCIKGDCIGVMNDCDKCQPSLSHFPLCEMKNESTRLSNPPSLSRRLVSIVSNRFVSIHRIGHGGSTPEKWGSIIGWWSRITTSHVCHTRWIRHWLYPKAVICHVRRFSRRAVHRLWP
jgi:hypothetical protein